MEETSKQCKVVVKQLDIFGKLFIQSDSEKTWRIQKVIQKKPSA